MKQSDRSKNSRLTMAFALALGLVPILTMETGVAQDKPANPLSVPDDWTRRHVIFSGARSETAADKMAAEPRYRHQWLLHNRQLPRGVNAPASVEQYPVPGFSSLSFSGMNSISAGVQSAKNSHPPTNNDGVAQDWGSSLGAGGTVGTGMFPAKFTFDVTATPNCASDYAALNTSLPTLAAQATRNGTFADFTNQSGTVTVDGVALTATSGTNTGTSFAVVTSVTTAAANLRDAINRNVNTVVASSSSGVVTVTARNGGTAENGVALGRTINSATFTWAGGATTLAGGTNGNQPSIVAYNQLYSTQSATLQGLCGGTGPSVMWSYSTGAGATVTSSVLSLDGKKIMYVDTKAATLGGAVLHILQWKSTTEGTLSSPVTPAVVTNWGNCAAGASCVVNIPINGRQSATNSAPFYDYSGDALYVGDDSGVLHKFTPVITGTPAEVTSSGWPLTVHSTFVLSSPVLDPGSNRIFVGDSKSGDTTNARMSYIINPTSGTASVGGSVTLGGAIVDAPIIDSSAGKVFVFNGTDTARNGSVYQFSTSLASQVTVDVGGTSAGSDIHPGAFDQAYLTTGTGHLFVCGKQSNGNDRPAIHRIAITAGTMSGASDGSLLLTQSNGSHGNGECSPVTELYNATTATDWIFFSARNEVSAGSCSAGAGCVMSLNVTGTAWPPTDISAAYPNTPSGGSAGSTSGIIGDNVGGTTTVPSTALSAAITSTSATSFNVSSTAGFGVGDLVQIDSEIMKISTVTNATTFAVVSGRGQLGTTAATHLISTVVVDLRVTLLTSASGTGTSLSVVSNTTFNVGDYIQMDNEVMLIGAKPTTTSLTVTRAQLGSSNVSHTTLTNPLSDLSKYPQAASIYFSFSSNASFGALCNGSSGVGCAVKLTQSGLQ